MGLRGMYERCCGIRIRSALGLAAFDPKATYVSRSRVAKLPIERDHTHLNAGGGLAFVGGPSE